MNEQLVNALIAALREQTAAQREQTEAINRPAESNVALSDVIIQSLAGDLEEAPEQQTYLSGKPRGDMQAGKLRHRITLQEPVKEQNPTTGAVINTGAMSQPFGPKSLLYPHVSLSPPEASQGEVTTRITIRYREGVTRKHRILFRGRIYNIEGVLPDPRSGREYLTLPCSEGG